MIQFSILPKIANLFAKIDSAKDENEQFKLLQNLCEFSYIEAPGAPHGARPRVHHPLQRLLAGDGRRAAPAVRQRRAAARLLGGAWGCKQGVHVIQYFSFLKHCPLQIQKKATPLTTLCSIFDEIDSQIG